MGAVLAPALHLRETVGLQATFAMQGWSNRNQPTW
jgi:hypothetical protein